MSYFSNKTLEDIPDYIINESIGYLKFSESTSTLCEQNVMNEDNLDDWNIDDFLIALPKTIEYGLHDSLFNLTITYNSNDECIIYYENKNIGKSILEVQNINPYDAFKEIYLKLKTIDKLD